MNKRGSGPSTTGDSVVNDTYYGTKFIRSTGRSIAINVPKEWPFEKDDVVDFTIRRLEDMDIYSAVKTVRASGTSLCIYCNREWGFTKNTMVVFSMRLNEDGEAARRRAKNRNSGVLRV